MTAVRDAVQEYRIGQRVIVKAAGNVFPHIEIRGCFFHLGQSVYRQVQLKGFQQAYNNADDRLLKIHGPDRCASS